MAVEAPIQEKVIVHEGKIVQLMNMALDGRENGVGIFKKEIEPPEKRFIGIAKEYGRLTSSEVFPLHTVFFTSMTLFADNSARQLATMTNRIDFALNSWLFKPEMVVKRENRVYNTAFNLIRPGYNQRALKLWYHNAQVLMQHYDGDLRNFFAANKDDAPTILQDLVGPHSKENWEGFHRFGPKLARLFLQWVNQYDLYQRNGQSVKLTGIDKIGIPVDFQVVRLTVGTEGIELPFGSVHKHWILDKALIPLYAEICNEYALNPQKVSETLWLIGNRCCNNYRHDLCPISPICKHLISRKPWDKRGLVDPTDTGRYKTRRQAMAEKKGQLFLPVAASSGWLGKDEQPL